MRIYLDSCCYNRPYDSVQQVSVELEARAKLSIQRDVEDRKYELVTSEVLTYEIQNHPVEMIRSAILMFIEENSAFHVGVEHNEEIDAEAKKIMKTGIHYKDVCHVASAIYAKCVYFLTTDKRLLKYKTDKIRMRNPIDFIREMEDRTND